MRKCRSNKRKDTPYENVMCKKIIVGSTKKYHGMKRILNLNTNTSLKDIIISPIKSFYKVCFDWFMH